MIAEAVLLDKVRGAAFAALVAELLATPAEGLTPKEIRERHGRLTAIATDARTSPLAEAISTSLTPAPNPDDTSIVSLRAGIAAFREGQRIDRDLVASLVADALGTDPFERLPPRVLLDAVERSGDADGALDVLRHIARTPTSPEAAIAQIDAKFAGRHIAAYGAIAALMARPNSIESAVLYAVAMGGAATERGRIVGFVSGAHRGAIVIPSRWMSAIPDTVFARGVEWTNSLLGAG